MGVGNSELAKLDKTEMETLKHSWNTVMTHAQENGSYIFGRFLKKYNYASHFKKFSTIPPDEIEQSKAFKDHSFLVISSIDKIISHSSDNAQLIDDLNKLGRMHLNKNLTRKQFLELKSTILDILAKKFLLPPETLQIWNKGFDICYFHIFQVLEGDAGTSAQDDISEH